MSDQQIPAHALLGAYPPDRVDGLVRRLAEVGVGEHEVRIDAADDEGTSLTAEMREEATESLVMPQVGIVYPKEAAKATSLIGPVLVVLGTIVALPGALLLPGDMALWVRLLIVGVCGAVAGAVIAVIAVPAMAVKNQDVPSAAQRGRLVRVSRWTPDLERVMAEAGPLRLDRLGADGAPIAPVSTEEDHQAGGAVEEVGRNFAREHRAEPRHRSR